MKYAVYFAYKISYLNISYFQTESTIVIKDIKPRSKHHYLVISRKHIPDAKHLTSEDEELCE